MVQGDEIMKGMTSAITFTTYSGAGQSEVCHCPHVVRVNFHFNFAAWQCWYFCSKFCISDFCPKGQLLHNTVCEISIFFHSTLIYIQVETSRGGVGCLRTTHILHLSAFPQISSVIQPWKKNLKRWGKNKRTIKKIVLPSKVKIVSLFGCTITIHIHRKNSEETL